MGEFLVSVGQPGRRPIVVPNILHFEGVENLYGRVFDSLSPRTFKIGLSCPDAMDKFDIPNYAAADAVPYDEYATFADVSKPRANEGGCYTDEMRTATCYARQTVTFATGQRGDDGYADSSVAHFENCLPWSFLGDCDNPATTEIVETCPQWLVDRFEPIHGYPWQFPNVQPNFWEGYDGTGELNWLSEFMKTRGFPITVAWLIDDADSKLVASCHFLRPVLFGPGAHLYVQYRARLTP